MRTEGPAFRPEPLGGVEEAKGQEEDDEEEEVEEGGEALSTLGREAVEAMMNDIVTHMGLNHDQQQASTTCYFHSYIDISISAFTLICFDCPPSSSHACVSSISVWQVMGRVCDWLSPPLETRPRAARGPIVLVHGVFGSGAAHDTHAITLPFHVPTSRPDAGTSAPRVFVCRQVATPGCHLPLRRQSGPGPGTAWLARRCCVRKCPTHPAGMCNQCGC